MSCVKKLLTRQTLSGLQKLSLVHKSEETTGRSMYEHSDDSTLQNFCSDNSSSEIVNLGLLINEKICKNERFCSFELFHVKENRDRIYRKFFSEVKECSPLFYTITWHATTEDHSFLKLAEQLPNNTLFHLTAKGLTRQNMTDILNRALSCGKTNIFALQGDAPGENGDFAYAVDLVKFIRAHFDSKVCICVAGYPEIHPKSPSKELDLFYLKAKVDAGANFIITQFFFDSKVFINFVKDCRKIGITVPIIPGIFPIPSFEILSKMTNICKVNVPKSVLDNLQPIRNDDEMVAKFGIELATNIIKDIIDSGVATGFHLFTLNSTSLAVEVCRHTGLSQVNCTTD